MTKSLVSGAFRTATYVVRHPARTALSVAGAAKGVASVGVAVVEVVVRRAGQEVSGAPGEAQPSGTVAVPPAEAAPQSGAPEPGGTVDVTAPPRPEVVPVAPGERLAAELDEVVAAPAPAEPAEQVTHEPTAVTWDSAHGGPADDDIVDEWQADAQDAEAAPTSPAAAAIAKVAHASGVDVDLPPELKEAAEGDVSVVAGDATPPSGDELLLDPAVAKGVRSESEVARKDAQADVEA